MPRKCDIKKNSNYELLKIDCNCLDSTEHVYPTLKIKFKSYLVDQQIATDKVTCCQEPLFFHALIHVVEGRSTFHHKLPSKLHTDMYTQRKKNANINYMWYNVEIERLKTWYYLSYYLNYTVIIMIGYCQHDNIRIT